MSKSRLHSFALLRLVAWLRLVFGQWHVEQEVSIDLTPTLDETNEPEPEAIVIRRSSQQLRLNSPSLADLLLVAEVSVSSADYDLGPKAALYASAGIADYWVLDMTNDRIVVHRDPVAGRYASIITYAADETVAPLAAPTHPTTLRQLLA